MSWTPAATARASPHPDHRTDRHRLPPNEPTTFLDIAHQVDLLRLLRKLNAASGKTVVVVLHDLNLAGRFCDHIIAMADGTIVAEGPPTEVIKAELVAKVFGLACVVVADPVSGTPMVVPAE